MSYRCQLRGRSSGPRADQSVELREELPLALAYAFAAEAEEAAFDEALADGVGIETAARLAGRSLLDGYRQFHRVCAKLDAVKPGFSGQEGRAAPGIGHGQLRSRGQEGTG